MINAGPPNEILTKGIIGISLMQITWFKIIPKAIKGIIDVMDGGVRVASSQFEITILEHLATK